MDASPSLIDCDGGDGGDEGGASQSTASSAKVEVRTSHLTDGGPEMDRTTYGLDIAKNVMQLHWVDGET
ncbi:MAG: hypothetical protein J0H09_08925, partial [Burkholderiales bacterium]|nr:hypothetical protein [Burkholderiales bacterium]